jgi:hypothetical protein
MTTNDSIEDTVEPSNTPIRVGLAMLYSLIAIGVFSYVLTIGQSKSKDKKLQDEMKFEYNFKKAMPQVITLDSIYFAKRDSMKRVYKNSLEKKVGGK